MQVLCYSIPTNTSRQKIILKELGLNPGPNATKSWTKVNLINRSAANFLITCTNFWLNLFFFFFSVCRCVQLAVLRLACAGLARLSAGPRGPSGPPSTTPYPHPLRHPSAGTPDTPTTTTTVSTERASQPGLRPHPPMPWAAPAAGSRQRLKR